MNKSTFLTLGLIICIFMSCGPDEGDDCFCKDTEVCRNQECILSEWIHELGGTQVIARNSFVGTVTGNACIDTLVFYNDTTRNIENPLRFGLIVPVHPTGALNVLGSGPHFQASDNEFYSSLSAPICYLNGDTWYANLHFKTYPDSVWMKLKFWALEGEPGVFTDSTIVMFYKKQ